MNLLPYHPPVRSGTPHHAPLSPPRSACKAETAQEPAHLAERPAPAELREMAAGVPVDLRPAPVVPECVEKGSQSVWVEWNIRLRAALKRARLLRSMAPRKPGKSWKKRLRRAAR